MPSGRVGCVRLKFPETELDDSCWPNKESANTRTEVTLLHLIASHSQHHTLHPGCEEHKSIPATIERSYEKAQIYMPVYSSIVLRQLPRH
jgi:hypothetical protein